MRERGEGPRSCRASTAGEGERWGRAVRERGEGPRSCRASTAGEGVERDDDDDPPPPWHASMKDAVQPALFLTFTLAPRGDKERRCLQMAPQGRSYQEGPTRRRTGSVSPTRRRTGSVSPTRSRTGSVSPYQAFLQASVVASKTGLLFFFIFVCLVYTCNCKSISPTAITRPRPRPPPRPTR